MSHASLQQIALHSALRAALFGAGLGLLAFASGCFGGECDDPEPIRVQAGDQDRDGFEGSDDCDDHRIDVHPGIYDPPGDGLDQDCDGYDGPPPAQSPVCEAERAGVFGSQQGDTRKGVSGSASTCTGEAQPTIPYRLFTSNGNERLELRFRVVSDTPHAIVASESCGGYELACGVGDDELVFRFANTGTIDVQVVALDEPGPFILIAEEAPTRCGDFVVQPAEECDDGNYDDGDGCSSACTLEP